MAADILNTLQGHLEQVSDVVARYQEFDTSVASWFKPRVVAETTRYLYRQVIELFGGGEFSKISMNDADMGSGTGPVLKTFTAGFIYAQLGMMFTEEQRRQSEKSTQSRYNVVTEIVKQAQNILVGHDNIHLFGSGNGVLTAAASARSNAVYTFAGTSDFLNLAWTMDGMSVDVWDSTLATKRNSSSQGPLRILARDLSANTVTLSATPDTSPGSTDRLTVANLEAYGPSTPTTLSSTWPGGGLTTGAGLTGDSFIHGIQYVNRNDGSEYYLGQLKSGIPRLLATVKAYSAATPLTMDSIEEAKELHYRRWGSDVFNGMRGIFPPRQFRKLMDLGTTIVRNMAQGQNVNYVDLQPNLKYEDMIPVCGIPSTVSRCQDNSRIDYVRPDDWGRVQSQPPEWYKHPNGSMFFPRRMTTNGNLRSAWEFKIVQGFDNVCIFPGKGMAVTGLLTTI